MEAVDRLLDHLRSRGATWEGCAVEGSHAGQCRVVSTRALTKKGQVIVRVPKEACLSALTASESTRTLLVELMQRTASTSTRYALLWWLGCGIQQRDVAAQNSPT
jgi:hypothetical protein